jgi:hypothetical protein
MSTFVRVWFTGYVSPGKLVAELKDKPAPQWGFYAQTLRALMDSFLLYLPLFLMGRTPPTSSYVSFIATEDYYGALILLAPIVFTAQWLLGGGVMHVVLRMSGRPSDYDRILNLIGLATLVVGAFLVAWDWVWLIVGGLNQNWLGISHLLIDVWGGVIVVLGLRDWLEVPARLGVALYVLFIVSAMPFAIMFLRSPL